MANNQNHNNESSYYEEDNDADTAGQKGGMSQQNYRQSAEMESERDPAERDDMEDEEISGW